MKKFVLKILFLLSLSSLLLGAEEIFSLDYSISYAMEHSPKFKIVKRDKEISRAQAYQGYAAVLPHLEAKYTDAQTKTPESKTGEFFAKLMGPSANISVDDIFPSEINKKTTELSATQLLFSFSGLAAWKAAGAAISLADNSYDDAREAFILGVKKSYYDLQTARNISILNRKIYQQYVEHAREVKAMFESQVVAKKDYLDARVKELEAKQNADTADKNYLLASYSFNTLMGRTLNSTIILDTPNIVIDPELLTKEFNNNELLEFAYEHKPSFIAFKESVRLAEADDLNAWGESLPSVYYIYTKQNNKYDTESQADGDTEVKMLSAGWKFFAGGANLHKINEKYNAKEKIYEIEKNTKAGLAIELQNNLTELRLAVQKYQAAREALDLSQEALKLALASFHAGSATSTQVNDAIAQVLASNINAIRSAFDYEYAKDRLNYSVGKKII